MTSTVYLDANVLVAHQSEGHIHYQRAKDLVDDLWEQGVDLAISALTVDEFWYGIVAILRGTAPSSTEPFSSFVPVLNEMMEMVFSWGRLRFVRFANSPEELLKTLDLIRQFNLRPRDAFHLRTMQQQNIRKIATFDGDFNHVEEHGLIGVIH